MSKYFLEIFNTSVSQTLKCYMQLEQQRSLTEQPLILRLKQSARQEMN